ncbi:hypothetical protein PHYSODRAFT_285566 [Phytophthora sojae]|uniref:RxLR effector protein n=2 Tax=Phytophthora sojae TaxID=67593 RepID=G4Z999_PHYSP|nr:hypothetical protein PHYSODRAFT_285566 [Phytophthora sojae]AEK81016.1 Avh244 [Phytophthora sojae]AEK81017.1 Avh244 [Phytophthora sojae]AEK81018.1 Avh244 [Phytophthora sojae]EGZ21153.1 hypothetical protein PHYSODRAFT_285566 [Phytophthora sojae]|eukprot:XP_009523870.1 hypothetical protein PHYSODRAFT_285566 [Phytophthora sojae]
MRGPFVALLVLSIAFIATTGVVASARNRAPGKLLTARLLRSLKDAEVYGVQEERTGLSAVAEKTSASLKKLKNKVLALGKKTKQTKKLENIKMLEKNKRLATIKKLENYKNLENAKKLEIAKTLENNKMLENTDDFLRWVKDLGVKNGIAPDRLALNAVETLIRERKISVEKLTDMSIRLHSVPDEKAFAESMQAWLSGRFSSSHAPLIKAWAESRVKPEKIYKLLGVDTIESTHGPLRQWLAYIQKLDDSAYYRQALSLLKEKEPSDLKLATVFQSLKRPELEPVAKNLQTELFDRMMARNVKPSDLNKLHNGHTILENEAIRLSLAKTMKYFKEAPYYHSLKTYTLQYAEAKGADLKKVKALFESNKPQDALKEAVAKVA